MSKTIHQRRIRCWVLSVIYANDQIEALSVLSLNEPIFISAGEPLPEQRSRRRQAEGELRVAQLPRHVLAQQRPLPVGFVRVTSGRIRNRFRPPVISSAIRVPGPYTVKQLLISTL